MPGPYLFLVFAAKPKYQAFGQTGGGGDTGDLEDFGEEQSLLNR
jgi:hypothetical protein